jgi:FKBP-type peptidyl-prolyl cis-trans isomerase SlyD
MPDVIQDDVVVSLFYSLKLDDSSLVEKTDKNDPLMYLHGYDNIIPGLEAALEGLKPGDNITVTVEPEDAYGPYDPDGTDVIEREEIPNDLELEEGMLLTVEDEEGNAFMAKVIEVEEKTITLDYNHPLAGKRLHFDLTITELREPTAEELDHGHVHTGHHHH